MRISPEVISGILERLGPADARTIAGHLRDAIGIDVRKRDVNPILYGSPQLFVRAGDAPPVWSLTTTRPAGSATPATPPAATPERVSRRSGKVASALAKEPAPNRRQPIARTRASDSAPSRMSESAIARPAAALPRGEARVPSAGQAAWPLRGHAPYPWQMEAYVWWHQQGSRGTIEAVTGTGKTLVGVAAIAEVVRARGRAIVLVPTIVLQGQWQIELSRRIPGIRIAAMGGGSSDFDANHDVLVGVVNSASRYHKTLEGRYALLIADECHRYGAESYRFALLESATARLGLTATMERLDDAVDSIIRPYFGNAFVYDYDRAITDKVLASFVVAQAGIHLSEAEREAFEEADAEFKRARAALINKYGYPSGPNDFGEFMNRAARAAKAFGFFGEPKSAKQFIRAFAARRRILAETPARLELLARLGAAIEDSSRTLVFTETKEAADAARASLVDSGISAETYHSDINPQERDSRLRAFAEGRCRALVAVRALDEGVDVPDVDLGVVLTASRQKRQMIQRLGRVIRKKSDGRYARLINVFAIDSPEDPDQGGHEAFYDLLENAADEIERFEPEQTHALLAFLRRFGRAGARRGSTIDAPAQASETARPRAKSTSQPSVSSLEAALRVGSVIVGDLEIDFARSLEIKGGDGAYCYRYADRDVATLVVAPSGVRTLKVRVDDVVLFELVDPTDELRQAAIALAVVAAKQPRGSGTAGEGAH